MQDGDVVVEEGETFNHDNPPVGSHVEIDVLRFLKITEVGNYTLTFSNGHEHEADDFKFQSKFIPGLNGEEAFGTAEAVTEDDSPEFGLILSIVAIAVVIFSIQKITRIEEILDKF